MTDVSGSEPFIGDTGKPAGARSGPLGLLARWWPALIGVAGGVISLLTIAPWHRADPPTLLLPGLAIAYLVFGAVRGQFRRPGVLKLEIIGLVIFSGCALLAVLVDPRAGQYIAGLAWIGHAAWDPSTATCSVKGAATSPNGSTIMLRPTDAGGGWLDPST